MKAHYECQGCQFEKRALYIKKVLKEETQKNTKTKSDEMYSKIVSTINGQSRQKCKKIVLEFFEIAYIVLFFNFFSEKILHIQFFVVVFNVMKNQQKNI